MSDQEIEYYSGGDGGESESISPKYPEIIKTEPYISCLLPLVLDIKFSWLVS